jgi:hypothetical protein
MKIERNIAAEEIKTARRCLSYRNIDCKNKNCLNKSCPLNKCWKTKDEKKWEKIIKKREK